MADGFFYGTTLSGTHLTETWDSESSRNSKLLIRQALLGPDAKENEFNVVEVETMSLQETVKIPIAVLKTGEPRHMRLDLEFPDAPVTFTLIQGSGPVHLIGQHMIAGVMEDYEDMEEMEEEMFDEEEFKEDENKRKVPAGKRKQNEEDEDEDGEPKGKKAKLSNNAKGKAASPKKSAGKK